MTRLLFALSASFLFHSLLFAGPARMAFVYAGGEGIEPDIIRRATAPLATEVELSLFAPGAGGDSLTPDVDPGSFDLIFIDGADETGESLARFVAAKDRTKIVVVNPTARLAGNVPLAGHPWLEIYWANASQDNYRALVRYLLTRVLGRPLPGGEAPAPIVYPPVAFYHPDAPAFFSTLEDALVWYGRRRGEPGAHSFDPDRLTIGIYFHMTTYRTGNHAQVDALVRAIEKRGHNALPLMRRGSPDFAALLMRDGKPVIDALLTMGESFISDQNEEARLAPLRRLNVPVLGALTQYRLTERQFADAPGAIHPGLTPFVVQAERAGSIEPMVVAGKNDADGPDRRNVPFPAQIEWRAGRALAWAKLHRARNAEKRVVFTYWSEGGGKAGVGGDPDDFLDVPASLVSLLREMRVRGYDTGPDALPDRDSLVARMSRETSNVGNWAPGELAARVKNAGVALLPEALYRSWFDALPAARRAEIIEMWGPPPGDIMVHTDAAGNRFLVIPKIQLGNILIAPHPDWGYLQGNRALMSAGALPPHHQYLAFFLWLQREWKADAWVSLFSNIALQPGKAADDHIGILLGNLPHIHPERLGANGGAGNKRKAMAQTVSWYNIVTPAGAGLPLAGLKAQLARHEEQPDPVLRAQAEPVIRKEIVRNGLDRALAPLDTDTAPFDELVETLRRYLADLERAHAPHGARVLGGIPSGPALSDMVTAMLGHDFLDTLSRSARPADATPVSGEIARALVAAVVTDGAAPAVALAAHGCAVTPEAGAQLKLAADYAGRLREAPRELTSLLAALEGSYIDPGPMDEPIRRPDSVPPGRSLYNFDQSAVPTPEAEAIGVKQAGALIAAHREKHGGAYPAKLAFVLWSAEIARNNGVTEAQILHLLGTRAVRNERGQVTGVELIPREELGRPRVDVLVTTSGAYRDGYPDKIDLIAAAVRMAAASPEAGNPVSIATGATEKKLKLLGADPARAGALALARVFSPAPNAYSPGIQFLAKSGDRRGDEARMADLYTRRLSHAYGGGLYGEPARAAFEQNVGAIDAATLPRTGNVNGLLDHPMSAGFLGGLNLAAKAVTGRDVDLYVSNLRDARDTSIEPAARALQTELRARYFNPKWLNEMKAHGYDGARTMMFMTDHLDLWDSAATQTVGTADWAEVKAVYVDDKLGLDLDAFFERHNPHAQQVLLSNLLGAAQRGHWEASAADLAQVARRLVRSAIDHGAVCEAGVCRNQALTGFIGQSLEGAPDAAAL
ncbi:MAG: cobaltochelatase subunit CobN, partial [Opitutaceae bacterium]|nr:cobaltochelatase subunit CobN [Opitutaceae bacterium]